MEENSDVNSSDLDEDSSDLENSSDLDENSLDLDDDYDPQQELIDDSSTDGKVNIFC